MTNSNEVILSGLKKDVKRCNNLFELDLEEISEFAPRVFNAMQIALPACEDLVKIANALIKPLENGVDLVSKLGVDDNEDNALEEAVHMMSYIHQANKDLDSFLSDLDFNDPMKNVVIVSLLGVSLESIKSAEEEISKIAQEFDY